MISRNRWPCCSLADPVDECFHERSDNHRYGQLDGQRTNEAEHPATDEADDQTEVTSGHNMAGIVRPAPKWGWMAVMILRFFTRCGGIEKWTLTQEPGLMAGSQLAKLVTSWLLR